MLANQSDIETPSYFNEKNIFSFILYFLPIALITGSFLSDSALSIIAFYGLLKVLLNREINIFKNKFSICFLLFFGIILFSSIMSSFRFNSLTYDGVIFYFRYLFFIYGFFYVSQINKNLIKNFITIMIFITILVMLDGTIQLLTGYNILGWKINYRVSGFFKDELVIGLYLSKIASICFVFMFFSKNNFYKSISMPYLFLVLIFILFTRERSALILYLFFILSFYLFNYFQDFKRLIFIMIFTFTTIFLFILSSEKLSIYLFITLNQISDGYIPFLFYPEAYEGMILSAKNIYLNNNFFIGSGANSFRYLCESHTFKGYCTSHPHNYYVQTLIDLGLIGFIVLTSFFLISLKYLFNLNNNIDDHRKDKNNPIYFYLILISLINFVPLIPSMNFYNNWTNVMIYIPIAIAFSYKYHKKNVFL